MAMKDINLTAFDLFKDLPFDLINKVLAESPVTSILPGQYLVKKDQNNAALYLLLDGEVAIYLDENENPIRKLSAGDIFGEISMVDHQVATASAISLTECRVVIIKEDLIWELVHQNHIFTINLIHLMANRFRGVNSQLVSSRKEQRLFERRAIIDDLTKLYNRGWLNENLAALLESCKINQSPFSYLMIDIDHFKKINDSYGHQVGDLVLQITGETLNNISRANDYVVRYGGEEMAMLLLNTKTEDAVAIAERVRQVIETKSIEYEQGKTLNITISIGVSTLTKSGAGADLIKLADEALYYAKKHGRNQVKFNDGNLL